MDIEILLGLQNFRNGTGGILSEFMSKMTFLGELNTVMVIMAIIYWCVSKEYGTYMLMGWSGNRLINGALKVTAHGSETPASFPTGIPSPPRRDIPVRAGIR